MFFELFLALFMALSCPAHNHNNKHYSGQVVKAMDDSGGDQQHLPPPPPPPTGPQ